MYRPSTTQFIYKKTRTLIIHIELHYLVQALSKIEAPSKITWRPSAETINKAQKSTETISKAQESKFQAPL